MKNQLLGAHAVPVYGEYAGDIHDSGQHLLNLINEILDLSRIEAGRYELNEEPVSLVNAAEECTHLLKMRASSRGIVIHDLFEPGPAEAVGGRARGAADLPEPSFQRGEVHAAGRRNLD